MSEVQSFIQQEQGKLARSEPVQAYVRLSSRLRKLSGDSRYAFMFGNAAAGDNMKSLLAQPVPHSGRWQADHDHRSFGHPIRDTQCRRLGVVPLDARFCAVERPQVSRSSSCARKRIVMCRAMRRSALSRPSARWRALRARAANTASPCASSANGLPILRRRSSRSATRSSRCA